MKTFTVKEISGLLGTNPETVRRWIRSGKLEAVQESRKGGNLVTEQMFSNFLNATPKYANYSSSIISGVAAVSLVVFGSLIAKKVLDKDTIKETHLSEEQLERILSKEIEDRKTAIEKKRENIQILEKEIKEEMRNIEALEMMLSENLQKGKKADER